MPNLEATFETLVDTFVFLDKNKDGYVSKSEMVAAINETTSGERSSGRIAMKRFGQLSLPLLMCVNMHDVHSSRHSACLDLLMLASCISILAS